MGMRNESKIAKGGQRAIDRGPVNSRSRCFRAGYDLVGCQMLIRAIEYLDDGLACSGHPFVTFAQQGQCRLHAGDADMLPLTFSSPHHMIIFAD